MKLWIIRAGALGDTLMLMPAVTQLRSTTEITLVVRSPGLEFARPHVHLALDYEGPGWHQLFMEASDNARERPLSEADKVIAFLGDPYGNLQHNLRARFPGSQTHIYPALPQEDGKIHVAVYVAKSLLNAGLPIDPKVTVDDALRQAVLGKGIHEPHGQGHVILHPGSGGQKKNYSPKFWLELILRLREHLIHEAAPPQPYAEEKRRNPPSPPDQRRTSPPLLKGGKGGFVILLGPAEEPLISLFREKLKNDEAEIIFAPEPERLISTLKKAPLFIGHDSGITHLSAMLGTPTLALFKDSPVDQWRPLGPRVAVIDHQREDSALMNKVLRSLAAHDLKP